MTRSRSNAYPWENFDLDLPAVIRLL
jgi:hypothetical protein